jgi:hypothetical protein
MKRSYLIRSALPGAIVFAHLESLDDPASWADDILDRQEEYFTPKHSGLDGVVGHAGRHQESLPFTDGEGKRILTCK